MNHIEAMKDWFQTLLEVEVIDLYKQTIASLRQDIAEAEAEEQEPMSWVFEVGGKLKEKNT